MHTKKYFFDKPEYWKYQLSVTDYQIETRENWDIIEDLEGEIEDLFSVSSLDIKTQSDEIGKIGPDRNEITALILRMKASGSENDAIRIELKNIPSDEINFVHVTAIEGAVISESFTTIDEAECVSVSQIPPSQEREVIFGIDQIGNYSPQAFFDSTPQLAIIQRFKFSTKTTANSYHEKRIECKEIVKSITDCATIADFCCPIPASSYCRIDAIWMPYKWQNGFDLISTARFSMRCSMPSASRIKLTYDRLAEINGKDRERIRLATERLRLSRIDQPLSDRIINQSIALEALFSPSDNQELSYRIAINAANYAVPPNLTRLEVFERVRNLYNMRSSIVHGSTKTLSTERVFDCDDIIMLSLQKAGEMGRLPTEKDALLAIFT